MQAAGMTGMTRMTFLDVWQGGVLQEIQSPGFSCPYTWPSSVIHGET
jgi:hypothetical protein